ncbi:ABC transporter substrate-binding protein [Niallia endozanthoxylica]|uniref:Transporter substrate-binding domain-containing protein n=1 Tax=Niallia endozanthoxylica TaxID=2036016 RepID=A0A5J5H8F7_9BACI|nr:ABC transporter substrate-binding protein [Niallia endozanthoxylica]KAA9016951.1 transporter substrate-binding domain-containing protein [Niallia endozanthoxylica]
MKKRLIALLLLVFLFLLSACGNEGAEKADDAKEEPKPEASVEEPSGEEMTIGVLPAESAIPIILAKEQGFFEEEGVNVSIKSFSSPNDRNVAVQAKELDAAIGDVMTEATFKDNGIDMKITSDISEDFKILSSPDSGITEISGLSGKKVSLVPNFILEYIMDEFAKKDHFDYKVVEIPSFSGRAEALLSNQIDGVVFTEPQAGMLVKQGAHLLGSSKEAGIKGGTIQFTDEMIDSKPGDIKAFYKAYNKAVDYMNETEAAEYSNILSKYQFPEQMSTYLSTMEDDFAHAGKIDKEQFDNIIKWTKEKGQIKKEYTYEELTDFSFIE